jgi:tetratricopeptide (TPR) repeat protein
MAQGYELSALGTDEGEALADDAIQEAGRQLNEYRDGHPDRAESYVLWARYWLTYVGAGDALDDATKALELEPDCAEAHYLWAKVNSHWLGTASAPEVREIADHAARALELDPGIADARSVLSDARARLLSLWEGWKDNIYASLAMKHESGDMEYLDGMLGFLELLFHDLPEVLPTIWMLNVWFGQIDAARATCARAIQLEPESGAAYMLRAALFDFTGEYEEAVVDAERAFALGDEGAVALRAGALMKLGRWEQAREALTDVIVLAEPDAVDLHIHYLQRALLGTFLDDWDMVIPDITQSMELADRHHAQWAEHDVFSRPIGSAPSPLVEGYWQKAYELRLHASGQLQRWEAVIRDATRLISLDNENPRAYIHRGIGLLALGKHDRVEADMRRAIELSTDDPRAYGVMAFVKLETEEYDQAIAAASAALRLDPENLQALEVRSLAAVLMGDTELAARDAHHAADLCPTLPWPYVVLGQVQKGKGDQARAQDYLERALSPAADDEDKWPEVARAMLAEMGAGFSRALDGLQCLPAPDAAFLREVLDADQSSVNDVFPFVEQLPSHRSRALSDQLQSLITDINEAGSRCGRGPVFAVTDSVLRTLQAITDVATGRADFIAFITELHNLLLQGSGKGEKGDKDKGRLWPFLDNDGRTAYTQLQTLRNDFAHPGDRGQTDLGRIFTRHIGQVAPAEECHWCQTQLSLMDAFVVALQSVHRKLAGEWGQRDSPDSRRRQ